MRNGTYYNEGSGYFTGWSVFVAGALIGAGIALLFAPQPGREMRGWLREYANRGKERRGVSETS